MRARIQSCWARHLATSSKCTRKQVRAANGMTGKDVPRESVTKAPKVLPQVTAGVGHQDLDAVSPGEMGAHGSDKGKVGVRHLVSSAGAAHRQLKEELELCVTRLCK